MAHHHKSNKEVEGNPDSGQGRGMPVRPDEEKLEERTEVDRQEVGLPPDPGASAAQTDPETQYEDERTEIDGQVGRGEIRTDSKKPRKEGDPFPPTHYNE